LYVTLSKVDLYTSVLRQETLEVIYRPGCKAAKRSLSAPAGSKTSWRKADKGIILLSKKYSNCGRCGRAAKEIEKKWKDSSCKQNC